MDLYSELVEFGNNVMANLVDLSESYLIVAEPANYYQFILYYRVDEVNIYTVNVSMIDYLNIYDQILLQYPIIHEAIQTAVEAYVYSDMFDLVMRNRLSHPQIDNFTVSATTSTVMVSFVAPPMDDVRETEYWLIYESTIRGLDRGVLYEPYVDALWEKTRSFIEAQILEYASELFFQTITPTTLLSELTMSGELDIHKVIHLSGVINPSGAPDFYKPERLFGSIQSSGSLRPFITKRLQGQINSSGGVSKTLDTTFYLVGNILPQADLTQTFL